MIADNERKIREELILKMVYLLGGINQYSTADADAKTAHTIKELAEAYKNIGGKGHDQ